MSKIRDTLCDAGLEDSMIFVNPDYEDAIIGFDYQNERIIYDFDKMVEHLMKQDNMEYEDAIDFIEYNTIRALPYMGKKAPIVMKNIQEFL